MSIKINKTELIDIESKRSLLQKYYQVIFCCDIKAMSAMARKYTGYTGGNDFINTCTEVQADLFLQKYEKSFINCNSLLK